MPTLTIRAATIEDATLILRFIRELAIYEKAEHAVLATVEDIQSTVFGANSSTKAILCFYGNKPVGFAVYFLNYSTWLGKYGLYLEDLYVLPKYRRLGAGKKLLKYLAQLAVTNNYGRLEWSVLDWNTPAIKFYESIGAVAQSEWIGYRLEGKPLRELGQELGSESDPNFFRKTTL